MSRREVLAGAAVAAALVVGGGLGSLSRGDTQDALVRRTLDELGVFTGWLAEHSVSGFIGEVGWPRTPAGDVPRWNAMAEAWYGRADAAELWVSNWASGEWWGAYPLATYGSSRSGGAVDEARAQAQVVEAHPSTSRYLRGVAVAGGAFGFPSTAPRSESSNADPGRIEVDYHYDGVASLAYLRRRGHRLARVEFRWERLQRELFGPLEPDELARVLAVVRAAGASGLKVVLDLHNYGAYYLSDGGRGVRRPLGSPELPIEAFEDVWRRIAGAFAAEPGVVALGLMNEPVGLTLPDGVAGARVWEDASRRAVSALRRAGEKRTVLVSGYFYSGVQTWRKYHPAPWIEDPAVRYEAHHYWDLDHGSVYSQRYEQQLKALAATRGTSTDRTIA